MADLKVSQLTPVSSLSGSELIAVVQLGVNKTATPSQIAALAGGGGGSGSVVSVNGQTGVVVLTKSDVSLANVDNTSDANKPVSITQLTELNNKQPLTTVLTNTTAAFTTAQETKLAGIATNATVYTDEMARDAIGSTLIGTDNRLTVIPDDGSDTITLNIVNEGIQDVIASTLVAGANVTVLYDDTGGTVTIASTSSSNPPTLVEVFTSSGTWTKAANAKLVRVYLVGGGGGGGSGSKGLSTVIRGAGGGGAGGSASEQIFDATILGSTETVTVGNGGVGGNFVSANSTNGSAGGAGNFSSFGTTILFRAIGGATGTGGQRPNGGTGGASQTISMYPNGAGGAHGNTGVAGVAGGRNAVGASGGGSGGGITAANLASAGGAGGGDCGNISGAVTAGGGNAGGAINTSGSAPTNRENKDVRSGQGGSGGGSSITTNAGNGSNGQIPGGGGGGGGAATDAIGNSGAGGAGARGVCIVTTYF